MYGHVVDFLQLIWPAVGYFPALEMLQTVRLPLVLFLMLLESCGDKKQRGGKRMKF